MTVQPNEERKRSYKAYVAARAHRNPSLHHLSQFLERSNSTIASCRIACLDVSPAHECSSLQNLDFEGLKGLLQLKIEERSSGELYGRILLIEDLCPQIIELLGSALNIDPFFFASHIDVPQSDTATRRPYRTTLPSLAKSQNSISLQYYRSIVLDGQGVTGNLRRDMNVPRHVASPGTRGADIRLARHCCSVTTSVTKDGLWLGLILVDPPISNSYLRKHSDDDNRHKFSIQSRLFQGGLEDFRSGPSFHDSEDPETQLGPNSTLENIAFYLAREWPPNMDLQQPSLASVAYYPLKIIAAEWMIYLEVVHRLVKKYEYRPDSFPLALEQVSILNADLYALQRWSRQNMGTAHKIRSVITFLKHQKSKDDPTKSNVSLTEDYEHILSCIDVYNHRIELTVSIVASLIQIVDSRRSFVETANIKRLTYLALVFVPLTFISSLFSMAERFAPGGEYFWIYFVVAIPVCAAVFLVVRPLKFAVKVPDTLLLKFNRHKEYEA
ncbi:MAG: hypothetical protein Q9220_003216 [cf. Caloplaca sp. 1 TL-2023]